MRQPHTGAKGRPVSSGLARVLSKLGYCSRSEAVELIRAGRVRVNGMLCRDPQFCAGPASVPPRIEVDGQVVGATARVYLALNKPRGLVTTRDDEKGRATVYSAFEGKDLPFVFPVGRLDQASEGLLLFTNDTDWAARITDPGSGILKVYDVRVDCVPDEMLARRLEQGVLAGGEMLSATRVRVLRAGERNGWLQIALKEGRNRHIRRMLEGLGIEVLRLVRVAIGSLQLGDLPKGQYRELTPDEVAELRPKKN